MIKFRNKEQTPNRLSKVMRGSSLVWEKAVEKTISFYLSSDVTPLGKFIPLPENIYSVLKGKKIIGLSIAGIGSFVDEKAHINDTSVRIYFSKSLDEFLGVTDFIRKDTEITITYK